MIQQEVEAFIQKVFGSASKKINSKKLTVVSNNEKLDNLEGYLRYMKEQLGTNIFFNSAIYDEASIKKYQKACEQEIKDLPQHIYNAGVLFEGLVSSKLGTEEAFERLQDMVDHHVMFLLLSSSGFDADNYVKEAKKYYRKFPEAINNLPEAFANCKEMLSDGTTKLA